MPRIVAGGAAFARHRDEHRAAGDVAAPAHDRRIAQLLQELVHTPAVECPPLPGAEARQDVHLQVVAVAAVGLPGLPLLRLEESRRHLGDRHVGIAAARAGLRRPPELRLQERGLCLSRGVKQPAHAAERTQVNEELLTAVAAD